MNLAPSLFWRGQTSRYRLHGNKCVSCNKIFFPVRFICDVCGNDKLVEQVLSDTGIVVSYTVIRTAPNGFESPYVVAIVKLDNGPTITGQIVNIENMDKIGDNCLIDRKVRVVFRKLTETDSNLVVYGFKFELVE